MNELLTTTNRIKLEFPILGWLDVTDEFNDTLAYISNFSDEEELAYATTDLLPEGDCITPAYVVALLDHPLPLVRRLAAGTLQRKGSLVRDAVPALVRVMSSDPDSWVRTSAAFAVAEIGLDIPGALEAMLSVTRDSDNEVRDVAEMLIADYMRDVLFRLEAVTDAFTSDDQNERTLAVRIVSRFAGYITRISLATPSTEDFGELVSIYSEA